MKNVRGIRQVARQGKEIEDLPKSQRKHHARKIVDAEEERVADTERDLAEKVEEVLETRYQRLRQSRFFPLVAKMAGSGTPPKEITTWLQTKEPHMFGQDRVSHAALHSQVVRFVKEVVDHLQEIACGQPDEQSMPLTLFDYIGDHYRHQTLNPVVRMEVAILTQGQRLEKLYASELELPTISPQCSRELMQYYDLLERYVTLRKLLGMPLNFPSLSEERQSGSQLLKFYKSLQSPASKAKFKAMLREVANENQRLMSQMEVVEA